MLICQAISPGTPVTTTTSSISLDTRTRPPDLSGNHFIHQHLTYVEGNICKKYDNISRYENVLFFSCLSGCRGQLRSQRWFYIIVPRCYFLFSAASSSFLSSQLMRLSGILGPSLLPGLPELSSCKVRYMYGNDCRPMLSICLHVIP